MFSSFFHSSGKVVVIIVFRLLLNEGNSNAKQERMLSIVENDVLVSYRVHLIKDTVLDYEPVLSEVWVKNISGTPFLWGRSPLLGWTIKDERGRVYHYPISITPGLTNIQPGDSGGGRVNLAFYGIAYGIYPSHFPEGKYQVSYWCFGDSIEPLRFTVVRPQGEDAKALELYLKSFPSMKRADYDRLSFQNLKKHHEERVKNLVKMADRFPRSVYAAPALSWAASSAWNVLDDKEMAYQLYLRVVKTYADPTTHALSAIRSYYEGKKNMNGFRNDLKNIIESSNDSNLVIRARKALKDLESEEE